MLNSSPRSPWGFTAGELRRLAELAETRITADHMCPDCGLPPRAFCPTCQGRGVVTGLQLSIWQRQQDQAIAEGYDRG